MKNIDVEKVEFKHKDIKKRVLMNEIKTLDKK
jgi:hypothetical protein